MTRVDPPFFERIPYIPHSVVILYITEDDASQMMQFASVLIHMYHISHQSSQQGCQLLHMLLLFHI